MFKNYEKKYVKPKQDDENDDPDEPDEATEATEATIGKKIISLNKWPNAN